MFDVLTNSRYLSLSMYQYIYNMHVIYMLMRVTKKEQIKHTCTIKTCMKEMKRKGFKQETGREKLDEIVCDWNFHLATQGKVGIS